MVDYDEWVYEGMDDPEYDYNGRILDWEATHNDPPDDDSDNDDDNSKDSNQNWIYWDAGYWV